MNNKYFLYLLKAWVLFVLYFSTARFGLNLNAVSGFATFVWPPTGIALAAILILGYRFWPAITLAAFLVNLLTGAPPLTAFGLGIGNTLEALVGAYLLKRFIGWPINLERLKDVLGLIILGALLSTLVSATIGVTCLFFSGIIPFSSYGTTWIAWWIGDALGNLLVASLLLVWSRRPTSQRDRKVALEISFAVFSLLIVSLIIFGSIEPIGYPLTYAVFPPLLWITLRMHQRESVTATFVLSIIAIWGTVNRVGPFALGTISESLLSLQLFIGIVSVTMLILSAVVSERKHTQVKLSEHEKDLKKHTKELEKVKSELNLRIIEIENKNTDLSFEKAKLRMVQVRDEAVLENIGEGLIVTDKGGKIVMINSVALNKLGLQSKEVGGKSLTTVIHMEDENGHPIISSERPMSQTLTTGGKTSATCYYKRSDNTRFPVAVTVTPLIITHNVVGTVEVFRDITHEKELEQAKDEFISLASHELRTPMTAIKGLSSMVIHGDYGPITEKLKQPLENIHISANSQIHLINDLLDVSRLQTGRITYELVFFSIKEVIEEVISSLKPIADPKGVELVFENDKDFQAQGDVDWVKSILNNLIGNALKFTDVGKIIIACHEKDEIGEIRITDTGIGIDSEDQKKLFGKFEQLNSQKEGKPRGSGLGLFISREVARKMGGDLVLLSSKLGEGTTFVYTLPKADTVLANEIKDKVKHEIVIGLGNNS